MRFIRFFAPVALALLVSNANGDPPAWWSEGDPPVIDTAASPNNHGPANIGQAKWMAKRALETLHSVNPSVAGAVEADLVGNGKPIPNWDPPTDQAGHEKNRAPLLLGQLKAIAHPFYQHLNSSAPDWVLDQIQQNHDGAAIAGTHYWQVSGNPNYTENGCFPWNPATPAEENKAIATIGQLKAVFSLRFETMPQEFVDTDEDGLDDAWEMLHFGSLEHSADDDPDEDGLGNLQEMELGSDPNSVGPDADGNGIADDWEQINAGKFAAYPNVLRAELASGASLPSPFKLWNDTDQPVNCTLSIVEAVIETTAILGYEDSVTGTLAYAWEEISQTGTRLQALQDGDVEEVIPGGFDFPFGAVTTHGVFVTYDGRLILTAEDTDVAAWEGSYDLTWTADILAFQSFIDIGPTGGIYYKLEADRLIVQFDNMMAYTDDGEVITTFQVALFSDGRIEYRYKDLPGGTTTYAQIGVVSGDPNLTLSLDVNETYPTSLSAIRINPELLEEESGVFYALSGRNFEVAPHSQLDVPASFQAGSWGAGWHLNTVRISTDAPEATEHEVKARMRVLIDTDGDGLMDDEEIEIGSSIYLADTDGDGISDWDEIHVNFTDPLNAQDLDGDGISDDMEKQLARQLLNFQPDAAHWRQPQASDPDALYEGLLQGDLDASFDYTGEGNSALQLSQELGRLPGAGTPSTKYLVEPQMRRNALNWAYYRPASSTVPELCTGQYWQSDPFSFGTNTALSSLGDFTSLYLVSNIDSVPWSDLALSEWNSGLANHYSEAVSGFLQSPEGWDPSITHYRGFIRERKLRVIAKRADHQGLSQTYLKVTSKRDYATWGIGEVLEAETLTIEIPKGKFFSEWFEFKAPMVDGRDTVVSLLPVEVVELSPKVKDEEGNEIDGSEKPNQGEPLTPFVEEDPHANRIAHRELKVRIGEALKGKAIRWSLEPLFIPHFDPNGPNLPPVFRGQWSDSPVATHRNAFEASNVYGANGFEIEAGQGEDTVAKTTVADDGSTAIRVNVPPIGFNQARIRIQIEGTDTPIDLIDMEVPAVIVIDPGHGTGPTQPGSNAIGGEADDSGELEHAFALDLAQRTRTEIRDHEEAQRRNIRVFLTRENTTNISAAARTKVARDNGCDVYMSIHFNDSTSRQHRDPFGMWDSTGNLNLEEDQALAIRLRQAVQAAITEVEQAESRDASRSDYDSEHWESVLQKGLDTCSDLQGGSPYNGNVPGYTPCRAALIEIEWMSHSAADALFNTNPLMEQMRAATAERLAGACIQDVMVQPEAN